MKRTREPWMPAARFGATLAGVGVNLLVADVGASVVFAREVFGANVVHADEDFAVVEASGGTLLLHADHTYDRHPFSASVAGLEARGGGLEIRLYECDPDAVEAAARERGDIVLSGAIDKPHGLREVHVLDPDGYCWVGSRPLAD